jgi:hypothetical protein
MLTSPCIVVESLLSWFTSKAVSYVWSENSFVELCDWFDMPYLSFSSLGKRWHVEISLQSWWLTRYVMTFLELLQRGHPSCAATSDYSQSHATTAMLQDWYGIVSVCGDGRDTLGPPTSIIRLGENIKSRSTNTNWILGPSRLGSATRQQEHPQVSVHRCGRHVVQRPWRVILLE